MQTNLSDQNYKLLKLGPTTTENLKSRMYLQILHKSSSRETNTSLETPTITGKESGATFC
jgi:hypothetical protein